MDEDDYAGPATVEVAGRELAVWARMVAVFEPTDGQTHWSGRLNSDHTLHELLDGSSTEITLRTTDGRATGKIGDPDPWGRYRVTGTGHPPFPPAPVPLS
jgi:hypothetical protein